MEDVNPGKLKVIQIYRGGSKQTSDVQVGDVIVGPQGRPQQVVRVEPTVPGGRVWTLVEHPLPPNAHGNQLVLTETLALKARKDVRVGDMLMTPTGVARPVVEVVQGQGPVYRVFPARGQPFYTHENETLGMILCSGFQLSPSKRNAAKQVVSWSFRYFQQDKGRIRHITITPARPDDITERDRLFLAWQARTSVTPATHSNLNVGMARLFTMTKTTRSFLKMRRAGAIERPSRLFSVEPLFLGLYHGDGSLGSARIAGDDKKKQAVLPYLREMAIRKGYPTVVDEKGRQVTVKGDGTNGLSLRKELALLDPENKKQLPETYVDCPIADRKQYIAGMITADGALCGPKCFHIQQKRRNIAEGIIRVARTLGMSATLTQKYQIWGGLAGANANRSADAAWYYHINIGGDIASVRLGLEILLPPLRL